MQINQKGRSMIEMLGVLSIIGVLSVGGLAIVGKARRQQEITQTLTEVSQLAESAKKIGCQYDEGYGNFVNMLGQSDAYPSGLEYESSQNDAYFILSSDVKVKMPYIKAAEDGTGEDALSHFTVEISEMDDDTCVNLASADWGRKESNGFIGASFSKENAFSDMASNYPRMDPGTAATSCGENSTKLYLGFRICH